MAQPYDLTGFASASATILQMIADQKSGAVKFAGGSQIWLNGQTGLFKAILAVGGSLVTTTTNVVRSNLTVLRTYLQLIAGGTGTSAANAAVTAAQNSVGGNATAYETDAAFRNLIPIQPATGSPGTVQATTYDLSGIAALQTTAAAMLADQQAGTTSFVGGGEGWLTSPKGQFSATLTPGGPAQAATMVAVLALFAALQANFDQLDQ